MATNRAREPLRGAFIAILAAAIAAGGTLLGSQLRQCKCAPAALVLSFLMKIASGCMNRGGTCMQGSFQRLASMNSI